jgi:hypothetical protein
MDTGVCYAQQHATWQTTYAIQHSGCLTWNAQPLPMHSDESSVRLGSMLKKSCAILMMHGMRVADPTSSTDPILSNVSPDAA